MKDIFPRENKTPMRGSRLKSVQSSTKVANKSVGSGSQSPASTPAKPIVDAVKRVLSITHPQIIITTAIFWGNFTIYFFVLFAVVTCS